MSEQNGPARAGGPSLALKLSLVFAGIVLLGTVVQVAVINSIADRLFRSFVRSADVRRGGELAEIIAESYSAGDDWQDILSRLGMAGRRLDRPILSGDLLIVDRDGRVVFPPRERGRRPPGVPPIPIRAAGRIIGGLYLGSMLEDGLTAEGLRFLNQVRLASVVTGAVTALVAALAAVLMSLAFTRPLRRLETAAACIASGDYRVSVPTDRRDEIGVLSRRFADMASSLEANETFRRRMVSDAAHELRTPITVLAGSLEMIADGVYDATPERIAELGDEVRLLSRLIEELGRLSELESGSVELSAQETELSAFCERVVDRFRGRTGSSSPRIDVIVNRKSTVRIDQDRMAQVLYNLLSNAVRYTPPNRVVTVTVGSHRVEVEDEGPGVDPALRDRLFERFFRGSEHRGRDEKDGAAHYGLGLSIAREIVARHGGRIWVEGDRGARFVIELPSAGG